MTQSAAASAEDFYYTVAEMVNRLNDDHSRYVTPWDTQAEDRLAKGTDNYAGIGTLSEYEDNDALIVEVFPNSPAQEAGLQRRDRITKVDGIPISKEDQITGRIRGPVGTTVRLTVQSPGKPEREISVQRRAVTAKIVATGSRLANFPSVGFLVLPSLRVEDMDKQVENQLRQMLSAKPALAGLIIDLRGNSGGLAYVMQNIASEFLKGNVGRFFTQSSSDPLSLSPGALYNQLQSIPVTILVDHGTVSAAEWLSGALQAQGRAQVVGKTTAGNTEEIYPYDFKDGSRLWVAQRGFKLVNGVSLEGRGVIPDAPLTEDWTRYTDNTDPYILKAVELIQAKTPIR